MKPFLILLCGVAAMMSAADAALLGYWDFNGSYARSDGTMGVASAEVEGFGVTHHDLTGAGTSINLLSGFSSGTSLRFFSLASIVEVGHVAIAGLNFTGYTTPTVSFAARNSPAFQVGDQFFVEYDTGSGWVKAADLAAPETPFQLITYTFAPGLLDNQPNVGIRLTFSTVVAVVDTFEFDNLQLSAVPEPGALVLAAMGLVLGGMAFWRRKTVRA